MRLRSKVQSVPGSIERSLEFGAWQFFGTWRLGLGTSAAESAIVNRPQPAAAAVSLFDDF
jgi:hypothetical protein